MTFFEYLRFTGVEDELIGTDDDSDEASRYRALDIAGLNEVFINYLNFGGYPEAVFSEAVRPNPRRYIKNDIIDKVLLRGGSRRRRSRPWAPGARPRRGLIWIGACIAAARYTAAMRIGVVVQGVALAACLLAAPASQAQASSAPTAGPPSAARGALLYERHCAACHSEQIHWRRQRRATDWASLVAEVARWQASESLGWSRDDVIDVARHLNAAIYRFPQGTLGRAARGGDAAAQASAVAKRASVS